MRIVSLAPSATEILFELGVGDQIVANSYFCDYPPESKKLPRAGSFSSIDTKKVLSFHPDLIFTATIVQEKLSQNLRNEGGRVVFHDPRSIRDILDSIRDVGAVVSAEKEADLLARKMQKEIDELRKEKSKYKPKVYIEEWYEPPMYSGNWVPEIVELAGGEYGLGKKGDISKTTSEDKLFIYDPDYIFVSYCGFGTKSDVSKIYKRKGWENVTAVQNKKVFSVNETILNRPGPRILQSVWEIRNLLAN